MDENFGIVPGQIYRRSDKTTQKIIGLKNTAIEDAIARGELPKPVKLTDSGNATGWLGQQLIELQRSRFAKAKKR
jgi:predicted DNA-binding transcriptional regulator AlpA